MIVLFDLKVFSAWFSVFSFFFLDPVWLAGSLVAFIFVSVKFYVSIFKALRRGGPPEGPASAQLVGGADPVEDTSSN